METAVYSNTYWLVNFQADNALYVSCSFHSDGMWSYAKNYYCMQTLIRLTVFNNHKYLFLHLSTVYQAMHVSGDLFDHPMCSALILGYRDVRMVSPSSNFSLLLHQLMWQTMPLVLKVL